MNRVRRSTVAAFTSCLRLRVLQIGRRCGLALARVRVPAPSRLLLALLAAGGLDTAHAGGTLPTGGHVVSGGITIGAPHDDTLDIVQTTARGAIDWQTFDVGAGEKVNFLQPGRTSSTLNRIVGNDASEIFGAINATGQVFLVNQNGIVFAPGSSINVGGLIASTLQISDSDYLAGRYTFSGSGGHVDNQGSLHGGFVALVGGQVSNTGSIVTPGGTTALAAGGRVTMSLPGSDLVSLSVDAPTAAALVHSGGIVQADGGRVLMTAKATDALLSTVINVDGLVQARSVGVRDGAIVLEGGTSGVVAVSGTLDASGRAAGQTGGLVKVLGEQVALLGHARVDVSGDAGGGVVRVGGDWHGAGADGDANAAQVFDGAATTIAADALTRGQGGNVVLWSDHQTQLYGTISASGGRVAGNGGAIETSSHETLVAEGNVAAAAPHGVGGYWLLDPDDITISTKKSTFTESGGNLWQSQVSGNINNLDLSRSLTNDTDVIVRTSSTTIHNGTITVDAPVTTPSMQSGDRGSLSLEAQGNIVFTANGSIKAGAGTGLEVDLEAGMGGNGDGTAGARASTITMDPKAAIVTGAANFVAIAHDGITLSNVSSGVDSTITTTGQGFVNFIGNTQVGGNLSVTTQGGDITQIGGAMNVAGTLGFESNTGDITQTGGSMSATGAATFDAFRATLSLPGVANHFAAGVSATANDITITDSGALKINALDGVANGNAITLSGDLNLVAGTTLSLVPTGTITADNIAWTAGNGSALAVNNALSGHSISLSGGSVAIGKALTASTALAVAARNGAITQTAAVASAGASQLSATGAITLTNAGNRFGGTVSVADTGGATTITAGTGNLSAALADGSKATTLTASAGDVTVTNGASGNLALSGRNIHLATTGNLAVTGTLAATLTALGTVDEQKNVSVTGATQVDSKGGTVKLGSANRFGGGIGALGANITLTDSQNLNVTGLSTTGLNTVALTATGGAVSLPNQAITAATSFSLTQAAALTLSNAITAPSITLNAARVTLANTMAASGSLNITATGGNIAESGAGVIHAGGTTQLTGTGNITLTAAGNAFAGLVTVADTAGATAITAGTGNLSAALADGSMATTLTASAGDVTVTNGASGNLALSGRNIHLATTGNLAVTGTLAATLTARGTVDEQKNVSVTRATQVDSKGGTVNLASANRFAGGIGALGANVTLTDSLGLNVTGLSTTGLNTLALTASGGAVTLPNQAITAATAFSLAQTTGLTLSNAVTAPSITLAASSVTVANSLTSSGNLAITATNGKIAETGAGVIDATGTTQLTATGDIDLDNSANDLSHVTSATAANGDITLDGGASLLFDKISAANGDLVIDLSGANSGITEGAAGSLNVGGLTTLTAGPGGDITVVGANNGAGNTFGGLLTLNASSDSTSQVATAKDLAVALASGTTTLASGGALSVTGGTSGTLTASGASIALGTARALHVTGDLAARLTAAGEISSPDGLTVTGQATADSKGGTIAFANAQNHFGGGISAFGSDITLVDAGSLTINAITASLSQLSLAADNGGVTIVPAGPLTVAGAFSLTQTLPYTTGQDITAGTLTLTAPSVAVASTLAARNDLDITATSQGITETGAGVLHADGTASLSAAGAIDLENAANTFTGPLSLSATSATVDAAGSVVLQDVDAASLALQAAANITQANDSTIAVTGTTNLAAGQAITLDNAANIFVGDTAFSANTLDVFDSKSLHMASLDVAGDATLVSAGSASVAGTVGGTLKVTAQGGSLTLAADSQHPMTAGSLVAVAIGDIGQVSALVVAHGASFSTNTTTGTIDLAAANQIQGDVGLTAHQATFTNGGATAVVLATTGDATIDASGALSVRGSAGGLADLTGAGVHLAAGATGATFESATLSVTSSNGIDQAGEVTVDGASSMDAGGGTIALGTDASRNTFGGGVAVSNASQADLGAKGDLAVAFGSGVAAATMHAGQTATASGTVSGSLAVTAAQVGLGSLGVGGALTVDSGGDVLESGGAALTVGGTTAVTSAGTVHLAGANTFTGAVSINDTGPGLVTVNALGELDIGLQAAGSATLSAGSVDFVTASTIGGDLSVTSTQPGSQGGLEGTRGQAVTAAGIGQSAALTVKGLLNLDSAGVIQLDGTGNDFEGPLAIRSVGDVALATSHDMTIASAQQATGSGAFTATAGGVLYLAGTLQWNNAVTLTGTGIFGTHAPGGSGDSVGALDVSQGMRINLDPRNGGIGYFSTQGIDAGEDLVRRIRLLGGAGQQDANGAGGIFIVPGAAPGNGVAYYFSVDAATGQVFISENTGLRSRTFVCDTGGCISQTGDVLFIANADIAAILSEATQDARDAAYGTDNLDRAIRKGLVTKFGRVAPDVDGIAAGLGDVQCDPRITSENSIQANSACRVDAEKTPSPSPALDAIQPPKN